MNDTQAQNQVNSGHIAGGLLLLAIGILVGYSTAASVGGSLPLSEVMRILISSAVIPAVIAILGAYASADFRIRRQWEKERQQELSQWKIRSISLLQRIALESGNLTGEEPLEDRTVPTAVYQYRESGPLKHLDSLFTELMKHYTNAPPGIDEKWKVEIAQLKRAYDNPGSHPSIEYELQSELVDTEYFKFYLEPEVTNVLKRLAAETEGVDEEQLPQYTAKPAT